MSISHRLLERRSSSMVRYLRFCIRNNTSYSSTICAKIPYAHFLRLNNTLDGVNYSPSNEYPVSCIFAGLLVKLTNFCLKYTGQTTIEDTPWLCNDRNMILSLMNTWERWLFSRLHRQLSKYSQEELNLWPFLPSRLTVLSPKWSLYQNSRRYSNMQRLYIVVW